MNYANFNDMSFSSFKPIKDMKPINNRYDILYYRHVFHSNPKYHYFLYNYNL